MGERAWNNMLEVLTGVSIASILLSGSKFRSVIYLQIVMAHKVTCDIH